MPFVDYKNSGTDFHVGDHLPTIRETAYSCAAYGAVAWTVYAIVECMFSVILPWLVKPGYDYRPLHRGFTFILFVIYPVIGFIEGGLYGISFSAATGQSRYLRKIKSSILFPIIITTVVFLIFIAHIIFKALNIYPDSGLILGGLFGICFSAAAGRIQSRHEESAEPLYQVLAASTLIWTLTANYIVLWTLGAPLLRILPLVTISCLLAISLALSLVSADRFERLRCLANPWTICVLLLGLPWTTFDMLADSARAYRIAAAIVFLGAVVSSSFFIQKMTGKRRSNSDVKTIPALTARSIALNLSAAAVVLGIGFFPEQSPMVQAFNSKLPLPVYDRPNVVLITMDTVRADHMSLYGYKRDTTPNIKKFAGEATVYSRSIASGDMTLSTHASLFTGMYAGQHGAHCTEDLPAGWPLNERFFTMAEVLSGKGYLTMGVVSNYGYISHNFKLDQGFQYFDNRVPVHFFSPTRPYFLRQSIRNLLTNFASPYDFQLVYRRAEDINKEVFKLLDRAKGTGQSFFLFINYMDAHRPHIPPAPFDTLFRGKDETVDTSPNNELTMEVVKLERKVTDRERNHLISQYDGGIAYLDFHIGELINRLKGKGLYGNTLVIITSDHGESFGERNLMEHGVSVYQDQVYIPLLIKFPNVNDGRVVDALVDSVDIMPTVLDVLGYGIPDEIKGISLLKLEEKASRSIMSESYPNDHLRSWHSRFNRIEQAIFAGHYKFISSTAGKKELFDLSKDPDEKKNLYRPDDGISRELEVRLSQWIDAASAESSPPAKLDKGALDRLKSLGYVR